MSAFLIQALSVMAFTAAAMGCDLRTRRIPNLLNVASLALAIACHAGWGGWNGVLFLLSGFATGFGILFVLWLIGGGGGGDVKLMGAVGGWLGPQLTIIAFLASGVIAVICRGVTAASRKMRDPEVTNGDNPPVAIPPDHLAGNRDKLPYGVPVAVAVWGLMGLKLFVFFRDK